MALLVLTDISSITYNINKSSFSFMCKKFYTADKSLLYITLEEVIKDIFNNITVYVLSLEFSFTLHMYNNNNGTK